MIQFNDNSVVFMAEFIAIKEALNYIMINFNQLLTYRIISDSRSALMFFCSSYEKWNIILEIKYKLLYLKTVWVFWTRAHAGLIENEKADDLAKNATI